MAVQVINNYGEVATWGTIELVLYGRKIIGVSKVSYKYEREIESVYGAGHQPIGYGMGNSTCEVAITILKEEMEGLQASLPPGMTVDQIPPTDAIVLTKRNGRTHKDVIRNFKLLGRGVEANQNDKALWEEPPCWASHVEFDVR